MPTFIARIDDESEATNCERGHRAPSFRIRVCSTLLVGLLVARVHLLAVSAEPTATNRARFIPLSRVRDITSDPFSWGIAGSMQIPVRSGAVDG